MDKLELKVPPPVVFIFSALLGWGLKNLLPGVAFDFPGKKWLALGILTAGAIFGIIGVITFLKVRTTINPHQPQKVRKLVTFGIYKITRNPMYLGMLLCLSGWILYLGNAAAALTAVLFVMYINRFQIQAEERILEERFGEEYTVFKKQTRRWI